MVANNRFAAKDPHVLNVVINIKSTNFTNFRNATNTFLQSQISTTALTFKQTTVLNKSFLSVKLLEDRTSVSKLERSQRLIRLGRCLHSKTQCRKVRTISPRRSLLSAVADIVRTANSLWLWRTQAKDSTEGNTEASGEDSDRTYGPEHWPNSH